MDGNNHILTSASNQIGGIFGTLKNSTIKNLTINDRWYSGQHNQSILACKVSSTLLENVSFNITVGNPETPYCQAPIDGKGSCGYLTNNTFQDNTVKNCNFNFQGKNIGSLFGWHSNMSKPTIINSKIYAKSLVNAMHICNTKKETIVVYQPKGCVKDASIEEELTELTYEQVA